MSITMKFLIKSAAVYLTMFILNALEGYNHYHGYHGYHDHYAVCPVYPGSHCPTAALGPSCPIERDAPITCCNYYCSYYYKFKSDM